VSITKVEGAEGQWSVVTTTGEKLRGGLEPFSLKGADGAKLDVDPAEMVSIRLAPAVEVKPVVQPPSTGIDPKLPRTDVPIQAPNKLTFVGDHALVPLRAVLTWLGVYKSLKIDYPPGHMQATFTLGGKTIRLVAGEKHVWINASSRIFPLLPRASPSSPYRPKSSRPASVCRRRQTLGGHCGHPARRQGRGIPQTVRHGHRGHRSRSPANCAEACIPGQSFVCHSSLSLRLPSPRPDRTCKLPYGVGTAQL